MQKQTFLTVNASSGRGDEPSMLITTPDVDRDGDIVEPDGMDAGPYMRNPTVFWGHETRELPVGTTLNLTAAPGGIRATWRWLTGDVFADRVANAYRQGVVRAASIGFLPLQWEPLKGGGRRYTKWQLLEWSLVGTPANPAAVRALKALGLASRHVRDDEVVAFLTDDGDEVITFEQVAAAMPAVTAGLRGDLAARRRHAERNERVDVSAEELRAAVRAVVRDSVRDAVRDGVAAAVRRATGRVD